MSGERKGYNERVKGVTEKELWKKMEKAKMVQEAYQRMLDEFERRREKMGEIEKSGEGKGRVSVAQIFDDVEEEEDGDDEDG